MEISDIKTTSDIIKFACLTVGTQPSKLPVGKSVGWFGGKAFKINEAVPLPGLERLTVQAMFQNENEVRVYACELIEEGKPQPKPEEQIGFHRITLSKVGAVPYVEFLELEPYALHMVNEFRMLDEDLNETEDALTLLEEARALIAEGKPDEAIELLREDDDAPESEKKPAAQA
jgi:hypothetical protein